MKPRTKVFWWLGLAGSACAIFSGGKLLLAETPAPPATARTAPKPLRVSGVVLRPTLFTETLHVTGTVRADEAVDLQAEVAGKITHLDFLEGAAVRAGDLLARINDSELRAALDRASSRCALAALKQQRLLALVEKGGVNQQDLDVATNELHVLRAEAAMIEAQLAQTEIRAPFDGVIGLRFISEGAQVSTSTRIASLQNLAAVKIDFAVPEQYGSFIAAGRPVTFSVAGSSTVHTAEIYAIEPRINEQTRTMAIRARAANPDLALRPGAYAEVTVPLTPVADSLLVPPVAVVPGLAEKNIFVAKGGKAERRAVQLGVRTTTRVQVLAGLQPDDVVITSGIQSLRPGLPVEVITALQ